MSKMKDDIEKIQREGFNDFGYWEWHEFEKPKEDLNNNNN